MAVAEEKWPNIGERISCVGHSSCTAGNGGGRMDGGAEGSNTGRGGSGGGGWGVMNSWPIPSRMPSNLCYKEGHPSSRQAVALYTTAWTRKHTARMPDSHSPKKGTVITARGSCASPRKLYYTLECRGMFRHTIFRCRKVLLFILVHPSGAFLGLYFLLTEIICVSFFHLNVILTRQ